MFAPLLLVPILAACQPEADDTGGGAVEVFDEATLTDANNYAFSGTLTVGNDPVAAAEDATVDWSALTEDLQGHALDPAADIDQLGLVAYRYLSPEEVTEAIESDSLQMSDVSVYLQFLNEAEATSCLLSEFTLFGNPVDVLSYMEEGSATWMLLLGEGTTPGQGVRAMKFFEPLDGIDDHEITATDGDAVLDVDADLSSLEPVRIAADDPGVRFDWSGITVDGRGQDIELNDIDSVLLARYDDLGVADLEAGFLDLETLADAMWTAEVEGETALDTEQLAGDLPFEGFTPEATWLLALRCGTCMNPAPLFLTVVDPVRAEP